MENPKKYLLLHFVWFWSNAWSMHCSLSSVSRFGATWIRYNPIFSYAITIGVPRSNTAKILHHVRCDLFDGYGFIEQSSTICKLPHPGYWKILQTHTCHDTWCSLCKEKVSHQEILFCPNNHSRCCAFCHERQYIKDSGRNQLFWILSTCKLEQYSAEHINSIVDIRCSH